MKYQPQPQHHKQQACTPETEEWQSDASKRESPCHRTDIDDDMCHDQAEHTGHNQPHRRITQPINHQQQPAQEHKEQREDDHNADKAEGFAENGKDGVV